MDPLSAVAFAGNILCFIDFSIKLISKSSKLYYAKEGALEENLDFEAIAARLSSLNNSLMRKSRTTKAPEDADAAAHFHSLQQIVAACNGIALQLTTALQELKVHRLSKWKTIYQALKSILKENEMEKLFHRLTMYRDELVVHLLVIGR